MTATEKAREDLITAIRRGINDPGAIVKRDKHINTDWDEETYEYEPVANWGARAVATSVVEPLQAEAERQRIALADALGVSHALTMDELIEQAREAIDLIKSLAASLKAVRS